MSIEDYLRKVFDSVDVNGDGEISTQEAVKAVKADPEFASMLGFDGALQVKRSDYTKDQLEMALEQLDTDESGSVSWEEFRNAFLPPSVEEDKVRETFDEDEDPFAAYLRDYEIYLKAVFDQCDSNSDGQLSYSEIVNALSSDETLSRLLWTPWASSRVE